MTQVTINEEKELNRKVIHKQSIGCQVTMAIFKIVQ